MSYQEQTHKELTDLGFKFRKAVYPYDLGQNNIIAFRTYKKDNFLYEETRNGNFLSLKENDENKKEIKNIEELKQLIKN